MKRALTADELAEMLAVSRITIFKQAKAGRFSPTTRHASVASTRLSRSRSARAIKCAYLATFARSNFHGFGVETLEAASAGTTN
jgi:hypothetical protein